MNIQVDIIIVTTTYNGLKGVIDRLGELESEINGGKLNSRKVLFSNWLPRVLINTDNSLKLSIKIFVTKSIEYALQGNDISSIGFVVPDSCSNETILAEEIINEARRQIEERKL